MLAVKQDYPTDYAQLNPLRNALVEWLATDPTLNYFVTFNFNCPTTLTAGRTCLRHFHAKIDRAMYGRNFNRISARDRTLFFAFPEHLHSNMHYHALLGTRNALFCEYAEDVWKEIVPSGSLDIRNVGYDRENITHYITKELRKQENYEGLIISSEFSMLTSA